MDSRGVLFALSVAACGICARVAAQDTAPTAFAATSARSVVSQRVRELFPRTADAFRLAAPLRFDRMRDGRLVPAFGGASNPSVSAADGAGRALVPWFASHFGGPMRLETRPPYRTRIEVTPLDARDVPARVEAGLVVYADAYPDTDVLYATTPNQTAEYLLLRTVRAPARWRYRIARGPGAAQVRQAGELIEVSARDGEAMLRATPPVAVDRTGRRVTGTIRLVGSDVLIVEVPLAGLTPPVLVDPDWQAAGDMAWGRFYHRLNVLGDGRALASGGCSASVCSGDLSIPSCRYVVSQLEVRDPHRHWFTRAGESSSPRYFHAAESLPSGDVLLVGGCVTLDCSVTTWQPEIFEAATDTIRPIDDPASIGRAGMSSARLADGRILIAGGCTRDGCYATTEIFDPVRSAFSVAAPMLTARGRAQAVTLTDGRVLVAGGCTDIGCTSVLASAELYDPIANAWTAVSPMMTRRAGHFAARLLDGRVMVGGGCAEQTCATVHDSAELFDAATMAFVPAAHPMLTPRLGANAVLLPDGRVLVNQGCASRTMCDLSNETFSPTSGTFTLVEPALTERAFHQTVVLEAEHLVIANGGCMRTTSSWWNETWDISGIVPVDGGTRVPADGGAGLDGGEPTDADLGPTWSPTSGCDCRLVPSSAHDAPGLVLFGTALLAIAARTRHRRARRRSVTDGRAAAP